jgi:hypothetical protein
MFNQPGKPLGPGSLGDILRRELKIGDQASVLTPPHKLGTEIDAILYQKLPDGRVYPTQKVHLDPKTLTEK